MWSKFPLSGVGNADPPADLGTVEKPTQTRLRVQVALDEVTRVLAALPARDLPVLPTVLMPAVLIPGPRGGEGP